MASRNRSLSTLLSTNSEVSIDAFSDVDLTVQPEILEIQVDDPTSGHGTAWQWTWEQSSLPYARTTITNATQLSVPLYKQGTYEINNFAYSIHGEMTQTHEFKLKWIEGAGDENLITDWVTYDSASHSHPDIDSGTSHTIQRLNVNVPSTISLPTLTSPNVTYTVGNSGNGAYSFTDTASGNNPQLGPVYRSGTYTFNISAVGHPLYLTTDNGTNYSAGTYFGEYTTGVTGSREDDGTLTWVVDSSTPDVLYYQCGNHSPMRGTIVVKDLEVETNENGNYIIYGQHSQEEHVQPMEIRSIPTLTSQMCIVYDAVNDKFVPQDLATYVENTPAFKNKIKEVAGTATLVAPDGTSLVASVNIYSDATYLPQVGNVTGDIAFASDTEKLYIWNGTSWTAAAANINLEEVVDNKTYSYAGDLEINTGSKRMYMAQDLTLDALDAYVETAPVGANAIFTIKKNGVSIGTITILAGNTEATDTTFNTSLVRGDYLTVDITQIGSSTAGADLYINFRFTG